LEKDNEGKKEREGSQKVFHHQKKITFSENKSDNLKYTFALFPPLPSPSFKMV
jgi:hypothetical protein